MSSVLSDEELDTWLRHCERPYPVRTIQSYDLKRALTELRSLRARIRRMDAEHDQWMGYGGPSES